MFEKYVCFIFFENSDVQRQKIIHLNSTLNEDAGKNLVSVKDGVFCEYLGYGPKFKDKDVDFTKSAESNIEKQGSGQYGEILLDFQWNSMKFNYGLNQLSMPVYDKKLWLSDSFFEPPTIRSVASLVCDIAGSATGQSWWLGILDDALFASLDIVVEDKDVGEVATEFGKAALTNTISVGLGAASNGLSSLAGNISNTAAKVATQAAISASSAYISQVSNSYINALSYSAENGWSMDWDNANSSWFSNDTLAATLGAGISTGISTGLNQLNLFDSNNIALNNKIFNVDSIKNLNNLAGGLASSAVSFAFTGNATFNILNLTDFGTRINGGLLELTVGKDGISSKIGNGGTNISYSNIKSSIAGIKEASKVTDWKYGSLESSSTLNSINMLANTNSKDNLKIAKDIWNENLAVEYGNTGNDYGNYTIGERKIVLSENLLGGGKEASAKLATVMSHEGSHYNGNRVEALAHLAGAETYAFLNNKFTLQADTSFSMEMLSGIMNTDNWKENTGDVDHWRIVSDNNGKIIDVKDDGDNSILTLVDEDGNIKSVTMNNGTSLSEQIAALSQTNQTKSDINGIMVDSDLDFDKNKGWYAKTEKGQYKVGQNVPKIQEMYRKVEVSLSEDAKSITVRDITVFQEEIEAALGLPHTACAIASVMMTTDTFLFENYGIGAKDSSQMIEILKNYATDAFVSTGEDAGLVKNLTALSAFYAQGLGMDDYLIFDDVYTSNKPTGYYVEKAYKLDGMGNKINNKTHFMTNTLFGYYDPDNGTNNRWWEDDNAYESVYRLATPKSSRIK